ncbi:MAG: ferredoxin [Actinomycetota bacterium]
MRVWIDQKACVGNGICVEICPDVFGLGDGDVAYVHDGNRILPDGPSGALSVPPSVEASAIEAAEECPAACIYLDDE